MASSPSLEAGAIFGALAEGGALTSAAGEEKRDAASKNKKGPFERATLTDNIGRKIKGDRREFKCPQWPGKSRKTALAGCGPVRRGMGQTVEFEGREIVERINVRIPRV